MEVDRRTDTTSNRIAKDYLEVMLNARDPNAMLKVLQMGIDSTDLSAASDQILAVWSCNRSPAVRSGR